MNRKSNRIAVSALTVFAAASTALAATWPGFECGMGIGGWLTNYKRFNVLPEDAAEAIRKVVEQANTL